MKYILSIVVLGVVAASAPAQQVSPDDLNPQDSRWNNPVVTFVWNDLGMHCVDREFSIYSILPPFNVLNAQVIWRRSNDKPLVLDDTHIALEYKAIRDYNGSKNSTSINKTDFWQYAAALYGLPLQLGEGLTGLYMPSDAPNPGPQALEWNQNTELFEAFGIPILPLDDNGQFNPYPGMRVQVMRNSNGRKLAQTDAVVPVSSETDCSNCHSTGQMAATKPGINWSNDGDLEIQTKLNVLRLHDFEEGTTLEANKPVLCAGCHYSPALDLDGVGPGGNQLGNPYMSETMHGYHGNLTDSNGDPVFPPNGNMVDTCYQCHPGRDTECMRGPMAEGGMTCNSCHGDMTSVGGEHPLLPGGSIDGLNDGNSRRPWVDLPRCQSCHTGDENTHLSGGQYIMAADGVRLKQAYLNGDASASPIKQQSSRFAENANTLYRFSKGHGGVACEACHGPTHAEWPNADPLANDNVTAWELQGHSGTIIECSTCHAPGTLALTKDGGPHGMHNVDDERFWDSKHEDYYDQNKSACKACHGQDLKGSPLGKVAADRNFKDEDGKPIFFAAGTEIRCDSCHEMP